MTLARVAWLVVAVGVAMWVAVWIARPSIRTLPVIPNTAHLLPSEHAHPAKGHRLVAAPSSRHGGH